MSNKKWGWDKRSVNWRLILCALGFHKWSYFCSSARITWLDLKVCYTCGRKYDAQLKSAPSRDETTAEK